MNRRDVSLTFALCASLVLHALLSWALAEAFVRDAGAHIWLPGLSRASLAEADAPLPRFDVDEDPRRRLGDSAGTGAAIDASPGEQPMRARQATIEQPMLSRDPVGPGQVGDEPSEWTLPPGDGGARESQALPAPTFAPTSEAQPVGIRMAAEHPHAPVKLEPRADVAQDGDPADATPTQEPEPQPVPQPTIATASSASAAAPPTPQAATGDDESDARPGPRSAADPAPRGESELDPVSVIGAMDFRTGSTTVRAGRNHKIIRPRLTLDAKLDLVSLGSTFIILSMRLDAAGNVTNSEVLRSSGSKSVDQVFRVTSYEWWFDPARDASDKPVPDAFQFVIRIN